MDNKRWYSRFGTIFWWSLAILPFIVVLIQFIGYHLTFNSGIASATELADYHSNTSGDFMYILDWYMEGSDYMTWDILSLPFINSMYRNLFTTLGITGSLNIFIGLFGWMTSVAFYHVLFDFSVWIFNWIHSLFDRWGCFK